MRKRISRATTPELISGECERILTRLRVDRGAEEVVSNPLVRSHIVAARLRSDRGLDRGA